MRRIRHLFLNLLALSLLSNCSLDKVQPTSSISITNTPEPSVVPTNVEVPTQATSVISHITPTPLPTFSDTTAKQVLSQFVQTNGGCELPCLFGLTPGISSQIEARSFLLYFQLNKQPFADLPSNGIGIDSSTAKWGGGVTLQFRSEAKAAYISFGLYTNKDKEVVSQSIFESWANKDLGYGSKTLYDDSNYKSIMKYFSLNNILNNFGPPSAILIAPFPDDPGHPSPPAQYVFPVVLIYQQKGFLIQYVSVRGQSGSSYFTCPANSLIDVSTWDPKQNFSIADAVQYFSGTDSINSANVEYFKKIDEATSYTPQTFYDRFKSADAKACIQTPKSLWHVP